jgi:hypothetical protein
MGCATRLPITWRPANLISWMDQGFRKCSMSTSKSGTSSVTVGWSIGEHREHDSGEGRRNNPSQASVRRALSWSHRAHSSAAVRNESSLGLACMVIRSGGRGYVQALHGLTGDPGDEVEVLVEMQHRQPGKFSSRSDDQVRY